LKKFLAIALLTVSLLFGIVSLAPSAWAATDSANGAQLFQTHCAGCHVNGGNIVRRGKNLKLKTLQRNKVDSLEAIAELVTYGKGNMSAYQDRLTEQQIQEVAAYVLDQAKQGW
jgi:cytochrome c6